MPKLNQRHLHQILLDGQPLPFIVRAPSKAVVRDHLFARHLAIVRLSPDAAFEAAIQGAIIETPNSTDPTANAEPPAPIDTTSSLFDATTPPVTGDADIGYGPGADFPRGAQALPL